MGFSVLPNWKLRRVINFDEFERPHFQSERSAMIP